MKLFEKIKNNQMRTVKILGFSFTYDRNRFKFTKISPSVRLKNVFLEGSNVIRKNTKMYSKSKNGIVIGTGTEFGPNCGITSKGENSKIVIGKNCAFGENVAISGLEDITIGNNALFASNILILSTNHNYENPDVAVKFQGSRGDKITIGSDGWVGDGVTILAGANIGNHCIIGSKSVVTRGNIPDYSVVAGNPARIVKRYNFDKKEWERC